MVLQVSFFTWGEIKGVQLISGTGKTMLVKAVANATKASFIRVVGSEFVQKYLGEVSHTLFSLWKGN
jgi:ATP-dependent 26S proteasome regulatory subunit